MNSYKVEITGNKGVLIRKINGDLNGSGKLKFKVFFRHLYLDDTGTSLSPYSGSDS